MPVADPADASAFLPALPALLSADELYDLIMGNIEPELMTTVIPLLEEKYKDEAPEQAAERAKRYNSAFERYEAEMAKYEGDWILAAQKAQKSAFATLEKHNRSQEENDMQALENQMQTA